MDLVGQSFGQLTVIRFDGKRTNRYFWGVICSCGTQSVARQDHLRAGHIVSCGCKSARSTAERNFRHGEASAEAKTAEYRSWAAAINRCHNPRNAAYENYGARGIYVCDQWRHDYAAFLRDMGRRPSPSHSLDRYPDNDGQYSPSNCRWATRREQSLNRRPKRKTRLKIELERAA